MKKKLLVTVVGNRNSGKSHTWNTLFGAVVRTGREERRLYFNESEYVNVFLVSGSPEERGIYVGDIITAKQSSLVLCSMQYLEEVKESLNFFIDNNYDIYGHWLNPGYSDGEKCGYDSLGLTNWLLANAATLCIRNGRIDAGLRVNEIKDFIYGWASSRNLIETD